MGHTHAVYQLKCGPTAAGEGKKKRKRVKMTMTAATQAIDEHMKKKKGEKKT
jgi:hypothetical protein